MGPRVAAPSARPKQMVSAPSNEPTLFLTAQSNSPVLGFLGDGVLLDVLGPANAGRVPVRVRSAMQVRAYVPETLLTLRVQRHGRVRGTPIYLAADNTVQVIGEEGPSRLRVRASPRLGTRSLSPFEGSFPTVGLGTAHPSNPEQPPAGEPYVLPANTPLKLYEKPNGEVLTELAPQPLAVHARVLSVRGNWYAVRVGDGPYLVGYTDAPLQKASEEAAASQPAQSASAALPTRLQSEAGELRRVVKGAKVSFDGRVVAKLDQEGYARVLNTYPSGEADALVAIDNDVTVRGLVKLTDLKPAQ